MNDYCMNLKFEMTQTENVSKTVTTKTLEGKGAWDGVVEEFFDFLRGCGYSIPEFDIETLVDLIKGEDDEYVEG